MSQSSPGDDPIPRGDEPYRYRMKGERMPMADMACVLIDAGGRIREQKIDRRFGAHVGELLDSLRRITQSGVGPA